jgi:hypothetical protein
MPQSIRDKSKPAGDLLWGVRAIARHIDRSVRQTQYLIDTDKIPIKRLGKTIVASRSGIDNHLKGNNAS